MTTVDKRILIRMRKELIDLERTPPLGVVCYPINDNIVHLHAEIAGPEDTPYQGGSFKIDIHIPEKYPFEPPRCQFLTRVYHPNIDEQGLICLDILKPPPKGAWKPSISVSTMLISLQLLLAQPNPDDPLLVDVATEFKENRDLFKHKAKEYTKQFATGVQETKEIARSGSETRVIRLKELESVNDESDSSTMTFASRFSSTSTVHMPVPPMTTALSFNQGSSASVSTPTERISLARSTHKKLNLARRPTPAAVAAAAAALSAPFVVPRQKSCDQGTVVSPGKDSLTTRDSTQDKQVMTTSTFSVKEEPTAESVQLLESKSTSSQSSYPSLQDTIPASSISTFRNSFPDATSPDTEATIADKKRGHELIKSEEPTTDIEINRKRIKCGKTLVMRSRLMKRLSSPVKEESKYFPGLHSSLPTPLESTPVIPPKKGSTPPPLPPPLTSPLVSKPQKLTISLTMRKSPAPLMAPESSAPTMGFELPVSTLSDSDPSTPSMETDRPITPRSQGGSAIKSPQPQSQGSSVVKLPRANPLTSISSTKLIPKEPSVTKKISSPQGIIGRQRELESHPPISDSSDVSGNLPPVSSFKDKGKSRAVDDIKMNVETPRVTDENESLSSLNSMGAKRLENAFSFMEDHHAPPTTVTSAITASADQQAPLTVAKKRSLLKRIRL
ncbi:Ubiquitin-conjugating enzyme E2 T [Linnemannia exigua]|uniref:E2 ubiquitin-conjugating enzyme n=1 Tax=Linnemannia exigua TaxID=604196 RepID=A0AAD4D7J8_9FUNG|nr:Ubiquitin-conjugating enzyme E2 T [Linnemannia exigua]